MKNVFCAIAMAVVLAACDTTVTKAEMETADYGPQPLNYQDEIKGYLGLRLTDPKAAIVEFRAGPTKIYNRGTPVRGEQYGWGVCVWVNDKNKAGAYDGFYPMSFVLREREDRRRERRPRRREHHRRQVRPRAVRAPGRAVQAVITVCR